MLSRPWPHMAGSCPCMVSLRQSQLKMPDQSSLEGLHRLPPCCIYREGVVVDCQVLNLWKVHPVWRQAR